MSSAIKKGTPKHRSCTLDGENPICELFNNFPMLNVRQVSKAMGVNYSLMQQYVNGRKRPSFERAMEIEEYIHSLGEALTKVKIR